MELADIIQNGGLVLSGSALAMLLEAGLKAWSARNQKTEIDPTPLPVDKVDKYVTRDEFARHVGENERAHENLFARLNANDKLTSRLEGILGGIREDLKAIKDKLFKTRS